MGDDYTAQKIEDGYGPVHITRFRICAQPISDTQCTMIGRNMVGNMPRYMEPTTASVKPGDHYWANVRPTLKFRGIARIKPFTVLASPRPGYPQVPVPVPDSIRDWMMPDVHTDSVGVINNDDHSFVVQTLKREYEDADDLVIRASLAPLAVLGQALAFLPIHYNQCHFLAGRRAWRFDFGRFFGYPDNRVVLETAGIERYSHVIFEKSQLAMGSIEPMVRAIWTKMVERFCQVHGLRPIIGEPPANGWTKSSGAVHCVQATAADVGTARSNRHFPEMRDLHRYILD